MPTHTPSPHRFLAPSHASAQKAKPKLQSGLRNVLAVQTPGATRDEIDAQVKKVTPAKRFVIAARRGARGMEGHGDANVEPTPRPRLPRKFERVESIEEGSQSSPTRADDDCIVESIEQRLFRNDTAREQEEDDDDEDEDEEILFVTEQLHKRRRVSPRTSPPSNQPSSPSYRPPSSPTLPAQPYNPPTHTHRFLVPPPPSTTHLSNSRPSAQPPQTTTTPAPTTHRPTFLLPPSPLPSTHNPPRALPEIFSPSRKTQKYIPDGLASTMQGWIIEAGDVGRERGVVWGREREDGIRSRVRVVDVGVGDSMGLGVIECRAGGVVFLRGVVDGENEGGGDVRIMLAGQGGARVGGTGAGVKIGVGASVGMKMPMWDVDVGGETWIVGVDWVML